MAMWESQGPVLNARVRIDTASKINGIRAFSVRRALLGIT